MRGTPGAYHAFFGGLFSHGWVKTPVESVFLLARNPAFFIPFFWFGQLLSGEAGKRARGARLYSVFIKCCSCGVHARCLPDSAGAVALSVVDSRNGRILVLPIGVARIIIRARALSALVNMRVAITCARIEQAGCFPTHHHTGPASTHYLTLDLYHKK
jgi:hypothetical protein